VQEVVHAHLREQAVVAGLGDLGVERQLGAGLGDLGRTERVQVHHLPDLAPLNVFGQDLIFAEGIDVLTTPEGAHLVYVTDSGDASVHVYDLQTGALLSTFPTGFGLTIEPILADDRYQRIFVAREDNLVGINIQTPTFPLTIVSL